MLFAKIFEALMLISFGVSWPAQIVKTIRVKNPMGKSFAFQTLVIIGYVCGILAKVFSGQFNTWLTWLYFLDLGLVSFDLIMSAIYLSRIRRKERLEKEKNAEKN
mgnify:CR=1 FL=1